MPTRLAPPVRPVAPDLSARRRMTSPEHSTAAKPTAWHSGTARLGSREEPNFIWLLVALLVLLVGQAWMPDDFVADVVFSAGVATVGLATVPLLPPRTGVRYGQLALCAGAILSIWFGPRVESVLLVALARLSLVAFFLTVATWTLWHLIRAQRVTTETLIGAVSGYLLLGIAFGLVFGIIEVVTPGALRLGLTDGASLTAKGPSLLYFSFITLTTVGYGDITPVSDGARLLAMAEGVTGQFYIAAVVARLISLQVSSQREGPSS
jgi:hypothetical protein